MKTNDNKSTRRHFLKQSGALAASAALTGILQPDWISPIQAADQTNDDEPIRTFTIDFNYNQNGSPATPGRWADADPKEHVKWYSDLGCNTITTFTIALNGYAWYKNGVVPEQPGLKYDFLTDIVQLAHQKKMKVMGYFCIGNNARWETELNDSCYKEGLQRIPFTKAYLDYLCASIGDSLKKTDMDGFMLDWFHNPGGGRSPLPPLQWLPCEQEMYQELMDEKFPGKEKMTTEIELTFRRKSIERVWQQIKTTAKQIKPNCFIWLSSYDIKSLEYEGTSLLKEIDYLQSEYVDIQGMQEAHKYIGTQTKLIFCTANAKDQDSFLKLVDDAMKHKIGTNDFARADANSIKPPIAHYLAKPIEHFKVKANEFNHVQAIDFHIAVLARAYNHLPLNYVSVNKKQ
ncbi:MAG: twin-arginine translocation signal domain-containing protein [Planctomycetaceae bacterium]|jgi:hypothetical protein|nr:twin-arginine translocation signal domain-containing protein [Planctomycetaceae bacterium]